MVSGEGFPFPARTETSEEGGSENRKIGRSTFLMRLGMLQCFKTVPELCQLSKKRVYTSTQAFMYFNEVLGLSN